jgi:hypothetical protein
MSSISISARYAQATNLMTQDYMGTSKRNIVDSFITEALDNGLSEELLDLVGNFMQFAIKESGGKGYKPEHQMQIMELVSEFNWIFFDMDYYVDEMFMNDTADVKPNEYDLICYLILIQNILNKKAN